MRRLLPLVLCLLPWAALAQESDKDFLTSLIESNLSDAGRQVVIDGFEGALSTRATMAQMTIADDQGIWLTVRDVTLDWSQSRLLSGEVVIKEFSAGEIVLDRLPLSQGGASPEAGSFSIPDLPVSIDIKSISAQKILLGPTVLGQSLQGRLAASMLLSGGEGRASLALERQDNGPKGVFRLTAEYERDSDVLDLVLEAVEGKGGIAVSNLGVPGLPAAELTVKGRGPSGSFRADVRLATDGVTRLAGYVATETTEAGPGFRADLSGDPTPVFLPRYASFFGPEVRLTAKGQRRGDGGMELQTFSLTTAALAMQGRLVVGADQLPELIDLNVRLGLDGKPVVLPLSTEGETRVTAANLSLAYDRSQGEAWQTRAEIQGLDHAALKAEKLTLSGKGKILPTDQGGLFDGIFDFSADGVQMADAALAKALGSQISGRARTDWRSGGSLLVSDLALRGQGFELSSAGRIGDLAKGLLLEGRLSGEIADLSLWSGVVGQSLTGAAVLDLTGTATMLTGAADVSGQIKGRSLGLGVPALDAVMAGESLLDLSLKRDETGLMLRRLNLDLQFMSADLAGRVTSDGLDLSGQLTLPDLAVLGPGFGGSVAGNVALTGPLDRPGIRLAARGKDLALGQRQLDLMLAGDSDLRLEVVAENGTMRLSQGQLALTQGEVTAEGTFAAGQAELGGAVQLPDLAVLEMGLSGRLTGDWRFTGPPTSGRLDLRADLAGLATGATNVDVLLAGPNQLKAQMNLVPEGVRLQSLELSGPHMSLSAEGLLQPQTQEITLTQRIPDLAVLLPGLTGALETKGQLQHGATGFSVDLVSRGPGRLSATTKGTLSPDLARADLAIRGTAQASIANGFAAPRSLSGDLRFDLRLTGPMALASLSGPVDLAGGRIADPGQPFGLKDMAIRLTLGGGRAAVSGTAKVTSGGTVTASGSVGLSAPYPAEIAMSLNQVRLRDPELYTTQVQGALTLRGPVIGGAVLAGTLDMGRTELRIPSSDFVADGGLPGLQHRGEPAASRATRARAGLGGEGASQATVGRGFGLDLRINAPNQVFIRGRGLDAELGGRLILTGRTDAIVPAGAFNLIRGRLDILGRRLDLTEALLQLQGRIVPFLRIVASVESEGILAEVQIEGPVDDPEVSFVSFPDLPQEEVLARLLFDRGLESLTAFQAVQLAGAVATLAGKGGEGVIGNLRRKAGVDNLDVQTGADGQTEVTLGKYLSEKAYTEVTVGQGGNSEVSINLDLAPHVTLKGKLDSEGQSGIGLFLQRDY